MSKAITVVSALSEVTSLTLSAMNMMIQAQRISALVAKAQADGKGVISEADWAALNKEFDEAKDDLKKALDAAK